MSFWITCITILLVSGIVFLSHWAASKKDSRELLFFGIEKLFEGKITSLKRFKDDAREVAEGFQCGLSFSEWSDFQPDDIIEVVEVQQVATKL